MSKTVSANNEYFNWNVQVCNTGPQSATLAQVVNTISAGVSVISAVATKGSYDIPSKTWSIGDLPLGKCELLVLQMRVDDITLAPFTNTSVISATETDPQVINNTAEETVHNGCTNTYSCMSFFSTSGVTVSGTGSIDDPVLIELSHHGDYIDNDAAALGGVPEKGVYFNTTTEKLTTYIAAIV